MELQNWISLNRLDAQISSNICSIDGKKYLILNSESIFDSEFQFILSPTEQATLIQGDIQEILFEFGNNWYYSRLENIKLNIFKYIGKEVTEFSDIELPYLGIHGEYDLCNGSRPYDEWCKKAKFLGSTALGICENNTLAGTLAFQLACKDAKVKSILGETVTVSKDLNTYQVKLYVKDYEGWVNLLNINAQIKVFNEGFVTEEYLLSRSKGLVCVLPISFTSSQAISYSVVFQKDLYCQLDFVEWSSQDNDQKHLDHLKQYIDDYINIIPPVLICDSYYLDKEHSHIKKILNTIGKVTHQYQSNDQYFKSIKDIYFQVEELSVDEEMPLDLIFEASNNVCEINSKCNFEIKLGELHLPQYEMTEKEKKSFDTNEDLFLHLIEVGLEKYSGNFVKEEEEYISRIEVEVNVIKEGGLIDYFLILWDIINWCAENGVLTGAGRGSAAGSLVSYCLGITQVDPLKYDLLFERFLNAGRKGSLPDIDSDFPSDRRDDVKRYMESRYGVDHVTSIGTYGTLKIKSGIKDLCRNANVDMKTVNYVTSMIQDDNLDFTGLFKLSTTIPQLKSFIQANPNIVENFPLIANQVKTASIHAAGVIIVPKSYNGQYMTIYDWIPVKKVDGVLITEWEGPQLEKAGYLKEDILGTKQLEKLSKITDLIKQNHKTEIILRDIPLDDLKVYELFQGGNNEDVFQLGAAGLKGYCRELQPDTIEDLIATVALYRPGPMESGIHKSYVKVKNGLKARECDYMMEEVTKDTYGVVIYQEQIMQAMQVLGGFNLIEADDIRKALGKKDREKMDSYQSRFLDGAVERGCDRYEAIGIWNKLEAFALYSFNKSHAACYAHIGYHCQWLKSNYPLEFWAVTLNHSDQEEIARRISEMHAVSTVKVLPPDINQSSNAFEADVETNEIFWSIGSIKFVGEKTLEAITTERGNAGRFFSFDEFCIRLEKGVDSRCMTNLILSGCFDKIEKIKKPSERLRLLKKFLVDSLRRELPADIANPDNNWKDYFWVLKQKELTGFGYLEFNKIYTSYISPKLKNSSKIKFVNSLSLQNEDAVGRDKCVVGVIGEVVVRNSVKGPFAQITINCNDQNIACLIWSEMWVDLKDIILKSTNKIIGITGEIKFDSKYKNENVLQANLNTQIEIL